MQPLRRAAAPQRDQTVPLTQRESLSSTLGMSSNLPAENLAETLFETREGVNRY